MRVKPNLDPIANVPDLNLKKDIQYPDLSSPRIKLAPLSSRSDSTASLTDSSVENPYLLSLDDLFKEDLQQKSANNLAEIAERLSKGERASKFKAENPKFYDKQILKMQKMGLLGKLKNSQYTEGERTRLQMSEQEKGLDIHASKTSGAAEGEVLSQASPKSGHNKATKYVVKEGKPSDHLRELAGAVFYAHFSGEQGTQTAKTRLVADQGQKIRTGSRWLDDFTTYHAAQKLPNIVDGKVTLEDGEVKGYIPMLVVAKFIQDFDCIGSSANAGYLKTPRIREDGSKLYTNVKIDPGRSFGFLDQSQANLSDISIGVVSHLTRKMADEKFHTTIPLDFIDPDSPTSLRPELDGLKLAIENAYPNLDPRDLLLGEMTYAEIAANPKTYHQMAKTIAAIVNAGDEELRNLIELVPSSINGEEVSEFKEQLFQQMLVRREMMHKLYPHEVEYMELYHQANLDGKQVGFEELKAQAARRVKRKAAPEVSMPLSETLKVDVQDATSELLIAAIAHGNQALAESLLTKSPDLNNISTLNPTKIEQTALTMAINSDSLEFTQIILEKTGDIDSKIERVSSFPSRSAKGMYEQVVQRVTPVVEAIEKGNIAIIRELLKHNPNINEITSKETIIHDGVNILSKIEIDTTPLLKALNTGNIEIINEILKHDPDRDQLVYMSKKEQGGKLVEYPRTALMEAIDTKSSEIIAAMFNNYQGSVKNSLSLLIKEDALEAVKVILKFRPDVLQEKDIYLEQTDNPEIKKLLNQETQVSKARRRIRDAQLAIKYEAYGNSPPSPTPSKFAIGTTKAL